MALKYPGNENESLHIRENISIFDQSAARKIKTMELDMDPYINLANAIVIQACEDYKVAYRRQLGRTEAYKKTDRELIELEEYFRSKWYKILTSVNGGC